MVFYSPTNPMNLGLPTLPVTVKELAPLAAFY
jgi:hypothetical protein